MTIRIEDTDTLDFTDIADTQLGKLNPIHPGEILREEFLLPLNMSVNALALALRVPAPRLHEIVKERRAITTSTPQCLSFKLRCTLVAFCFYQFITWLTQWNSLEFCLVFCNACQIGCVVDCQVLQCPVSD